MTTAFERATAPVGAPYIAPLLKEHWFRCDMTSRAGIYKFGYETTGITSTPVQIFADGEWNTVVEPISQRTYNEALWAQRRMQKAAIPVDSRHSGKG